MADFLVRIALRRPDGIGDSEWRAVLDSGRRLGPDYRLRGVIQRI